MTTAAATITQWKCDGDGCRRAQATYLREMPPGWIQFSRNSVDNGDAMHEPLYHFCSPDHFVRWLADHVTVRLGLRREGHGDASRLLGDVASLTPRHIGSLIDGTDGPPPT